MSDKLDYYVIDTSSLIELNRRYRVKVFPGVWKKMEELVNRGFLISPKEVLKELERGDDEVKEWARKQTKLFKDLNAEQLNIVKEILVKYPSLAKSETLGPVADPFVIS